MLAVPALARAGHRDLAELALAGQEKLLGAPAQWNERIAAGPALV